MEKVLIFGEWEACNEQVKSTLKKAKIHFDKGSFKNVREQLIKNCDLVILCLEATELPNYTKHIIDLKQHHDSVPILVISDNEHWEAVFTLMKVGINEYLHFPFSKDKFRRVVEQSLRLYQLTKRIFVTEDPGITSPFEGMVGRSESMQDNFRMISAVAKSNATVLITGESGTGKELVAKAIHRRSERIQNAFVDLNCGAIPKDLLENELFGHERGAFTGAHKRYSGSFEAAHKGTLFLDEISEMDPLLQVKLLRVLQERSFMRIGGTEKIDVDVRILAATNRNLAQTIEKGLFREDLFYRLNVVNINVPSLRERREDIPLLASHFLQYCSAKNNRIFIDFATDAIESLINYDWPGNVRELENTIERIVVLNNDTQVKIKHLPKVIQKVNRDITYTDVSRGKVEETRVIPLDELEKQAIEMALMTFHGNISVVAKKLNVGQATLYRKVKKYGLEQ